MPAPGEAPQTVAEEFKLCKNLNGSHLAWFRRHGITASQIGRVYMLRDKVVFLSSTAFEFLRYCPSGDEETVEAYIFMAGDSSHHWVDLVAWHPKTKRLASLMGRVAMLGEEHALAPRLSEGLRVHRDPLPWIRDGGRGVVLIEPRMACALLRDAGPLVVEKVAEAAALHEALSDMPVPTILVPQQEASR